jgi:hypothetical protein
MAYDYEADNPEDVQYDDEGNPLPPDAKSASPDKPAQSRVVQAMKTLVDNGYSPAQAAGVVGNLMGESGASSIRAFTATAARATELVSGTTNVGAHLASLPTRRVRPWTISIRR